METGPAWVLRGSGGGFLKRRDALGYAAVVDVPGVALKKPLQRRFRPARRFLGHTQIIPQGERTFRVDSGSVQGALVPDRGDGRLAFFHEGQAKQRAALHGVAEGAAVVAGFGDFLEFANGFFEKTHLAESGAEIVVRLEILFLGAHFAKLGAKLLKDFLERAGFRRRRRRRRSFRPWRRRDRSARLRIGEGRSQCV